MYTDAHLHLFDYAQKMQIQNAQTFACMLDSMPKTRYCTSAHQKKEFLWQEKLANILGKHRIRLSFGIHPQNPTIQTYRFLEELCKNNRITAIGEIGFDLFTQEYRNTLKQQKQVWALQIELAKKYTLPIIIHSRKSTPVFFKEIHHLKKLPAIIFHGWEGSPIEAKSFLKKGIHAFFSLGKNLLRGKKNTQHSAKDIPLEHILVETDAPYMNLKNEAFSKPQDIIAIYTFLAKAKNIQKKEFPKFLQQIEQNFIRALPLR